MANFLAFEASCHMNICFLEVFGRSEKQFVDKKAIAVSDIVLLLGHFYGSHSSFFRQFGESSDCDPFNVRVEISVQRVLALIPVSTPLIIGEVCWRSPLAFDTLVSVPMISLFQYSIISAAVPAESNFKWNFPPLFRKA